jgi:hypothetical protein
MIVQDERRFAEEGVTVWLAGLNPDVRNYIRASGLADRLGSERMFPNARAGIRRYLGASETAAQQVSEAQKGSEKLG